VVLDAAQDGTYLQPAGAPPGSYRWYSIAHGTLDLTTYGGDAECGWSGSDHQTLTPGFANGSLIVQLDVPDPAYKLVIGDTRSMTVTRAGTDPECTGTMQMPVPEPFAYTEQPHVSPSLTLDDQESHITPQTYDWDTTSRWTLAPGG
jgi:hypothetical protein